eukprot:9487732-Pyramimonas_sp.AAC.1
MNAGKPTHDVLTPRLVACTLRVVDAHLQWPQRTEQRSPRRLLPSQCPTRGRSAMDWPRGPARASAGYVRRAL